MTDETQTPALPKNYFTSQTAREQHFQQTVRAVEQTAPSQVQPHAEDAKLLADCMRVKLPDGKLRYFNDPKFRSTIESYRAKVFAGERIPQEVIAATRAQMRGEQPPAPAAAPAEVVPPLGSPLERAQAMLDADGGYIDGDYWNNVPAEVRSELAGGYEIDLPDGYVLSGDDVQQLKAARRAGISQQQINAFIRELRKEGG